MISEAVIFFCLTLLQHLVIGDQTNKYCEMCDTPGSHTMCKYPSGPSELCKNYDSRVLSAQDKKLILLEHNKIRNKVALGLLENRFGVLPPAANMRQLAWDDELQEVAQRWVDQCMSFGSDHQKDACRKSSRFEVGQNVGAAATTQRTSPNYPHLIDLFYMDYRDFDPKWLTRYENTAALKGSEQFMQLIWANTALLGCAFASFQDQTHANFRWINRIVCNYGPAGNVVGEKVYEVGLPCSYCPDGTTCNPHFGGLCATESQLKEDSKDSPEYKILETTQTDLIYTSESNTTLPLLVTLEMRIFNDINDDAPTTPTHTFHENDNVKDISLISTTFPLSEMPISGKISWATESNTENIVEANSFGSVKEFTTAQISTMEYEESILTETSKQTIESITLMLPSKLSVEEEVLQSVSNATLPTDNLTIQEITAFERKFVFSSKHYRKPVCVCPVDDEGNILAGADQMQASVEIKIILFLFNGALILAR